MMTDNSSNDEEKKQEILQDPYSSMADLYGKISQDNADFVNSARDEVDRIAYQDYQMKWLRNVIVRMNESNDVDPYDQKLRETLNKYNATIEEWKTNTGNVWINRWAIIKDLNQWQLDRAKERENQDLIDRSIFTERERITY